jgi:DnaK suppressor protein
MIVDLNRLRSHLESRREYLMGELEQLETVIRQTTAQREGNPFGTDDSDGATDSLELDRCLALQKQTIERLNEIEYALRKFEQGTYGLCDGCGQQIDPARLEALPQANLCLSCKVRKGGKWIMKDNKAETRRKTQTTHDTGDANSQPDWEDWFETFEEE